MKHVEISSFDGTDHLKSVQTMYKVTELEIGQEMSKAWLAVRVNIFTGAGRGNYKIDEKLLLLISII